MTDLSHDLTPFSIIEAAYLLTATIPHHPGGSVFVIVVDPGVGTEREILALKSVSNHYFVGPNNGIFGNVFSKTDIATCVNVTNKKYFHQPVSKTFHGRDIMAPVGAHITAGAPLREFGTKFNLDMLVSRPLTLHIDEKERKIECTVQYVDSFGNITTNVPLEGNQIKEGELTFEKNHGVTFMVEGKEYKGTYQTHFGGVEKQALLFLRGSTGFLEISKNQGDLARELGIQTGQELSLQI